MMPVKLDQGWGEFRRQLEYSAINVLERGQRLFACGEDGSGRGRKTTTKPASVKQEPTEATMHEVSHA